MTPPAVPPAATTSTAASSSDTLAPQILRTLPPPILPGRQVTPAVGTPARAALEQRARQLRKRSAEAPPDDPRLTGAGPEAETIVGI